MAVPALRQPKFMTTTPETVRKRDVTDSNYIFLTLKNNNKLVLNSDAYHGILTENETYRCVFCAMSMELDSKCKELHKNSLKHRNMMNEVPYIDEFPEHLLRKLNKDESYCLMCNVLLPTYSIPRHITTEAHNQELEKATARALTYTPYSSS